MDEPKLCSLVFEWPCLSPGEWAAWFQAIASVLAILIAIAIPAFQRYMDRRDSLLKARRQAVTTAVQMLPHLQDIGRMLTQILNTEATEAAINNPNALGPTTRSLLNHPSVATVSVHLERLGSAQTYADKIVFNIYRAREITDDEGDTTRTWSPRKFYERMSDARDAVTKALDAIDEMVASTTRSD